MHVELVMLLRVTAFLAKPHYGKSSILPIMPLNE